METGESTGAQIKTDNVSIAVREAGSSSSHSTRDNQKESASPKIANWKTSVRYRVIIFIEVVVCPLFLGGLIASHRSRNHELWGLELWKWCVLVLVIVGGYPIMKLVIYFVVYLIKKIFYFMKCKVRYSYYIYSLGKHVGVFLWFGSILLTCYLLFKSSKVKRSKLDSNVQKYIMRSLATCAIGGFLWVLKTLLVNILTPTFQATRLFDRLQESLIDQYILEAFSPNKDSAAELTKVVDINWIKQNNLPEHGCITGEKMNVINWLKKIEPEEICAWPMKELIKVIRFTPLSSITEELETLAKKEPDMTKLFNETVKIANQIFRSTDDTIEEGELKSRFNDEAADVVQHINGGEKVVRKEDIMLDKQALRKWLVNAVVERRSLVQSLEDSKRAKKELNEIVCGAVFILVFIFWLILLGILTTGALVVLITQFAALAFIFGETGKSVFQGIVFVSATHPFDIGDSCLINGEEMVVERINLLSTVFRKNMKDKIVYPNSVLTTMHIKNLDKGNRHVIRDSFEITIDSSTPQDRIDDLKDEITNFLKEEKHEEKWLQKGIVFNLKEIENRKLKIVLGLYYRKTEPRRDWEIVSSRRDLIVTKLKMLLQDENGQRKEEEKGKNKDDGQRKEEEKGKNKGHGQKKEKQKIKYYNILPKPVDAE